MALFIGLAYYDVVHLLANIVSIGVEVVSAVCLAHGIVHRFARLACSIVRRAACLAYSILSIGLPIYLHCGLGS